MRPTDYPPTAPLRNRKLDQARPSTAYNMCLGVGRPYVGRCVCVLVGDLLKCAGSDNLQLKPDGWNMTFFATREAQQAKLVLEPAVGDH